LGRVRSIEGRWRYIVFQIMSDKELEYEDVARDLWSVLLKLFGEVGVSFMNLKVIDYDKRSGFGILRCTHKTVDIVHAGVSMISEIRGTPILTDIKKVTGSIKKARETVEKLKIQVDR